MRELLLLLSLRKTVMRLREMQRRAKKKQMMRVMVMVSVDTLEREQTKQRSTGRSQSSFLTGLGSFSAAEASAKRCSLVSESG